MRRFTEKPDAQRAQQFVEAGNYYWNSGMFIWSAQTLVDALREYLPDTAGRLEQASELSTHRQAPATRHVRRSARSRSARRRAA